MSAATTAATILELLRASARRNDLERGRLQAHTLVGAAGDLAAGSFARAAAEAEQDARAGDARRFFLSVDTACREFVRLSTRPLSASSPHRTP